MNTEKIVRETKIMIAVCMIVGVILLGFGIIFRVLDVSFISNKKALIGLSFIPFSVAFIYWVKLFRMNHSPEKMKNILITENDERLVALKNEIDARAFKIIQGAIFLGYMGYTLMVPEDIFESAGWWVLLALLFITFISQAILANRIMAANKPEDGE